MSNYVCEVHQFAEKSPCILMSEERLSEFKTCGLQLYIW